MTEHRKSIDNHDAVAADAFFEALRRVLSLRQMSALDMFARDGALTVNRYAKHVRRLELWELNQVHLPALRRYGASEVKIGCTYKFLKECTSTYGMIVVDNPQGLYPDNWGVVHAEHFDIVKELSPIMADRCVVVLYVNKAPYDKNKDGDHGRDTYSAYDFQRWMTARGDFYGHVEVDEVRALNTYKYVFAAQGFTVTDVLMVPCFRGEGLPPSFRLGLVLERM